jgi:hypothetical protein
MKVNSLAIALLLNSAQAVKISQKVQSQVQESNAINQDLDTLFQLSQIKEGGPSSTKSSSGSGSAYVVTIADDSKLPWITQKPLEQTCSGSLQRLLRESEGRIKVEGALFNDLSFPANQTSVQWTGTARQ